MASETSVFDGCEQVSTTLLRLDAIPRLAHTPSFPVEEFIEKFKSALHLENLQLEFSAWEWYSENDYAHGFGENPTLLTLEISPLKGEAFWLMAQDDTSRLLSCLLLKGSSDTQELPLPDVKEGFFSYIILEALSILCTLPTMNKLSPKIKKDTSIPSGATLSLNIQVSIEGISFLSRLLLSAELVQSVRETFREKKLSPESLKKAEAVELPLQIEAGKVELSFQEWQSLKNGDFVLLDSCGLDPETGFGSVFISTQGHSLFKGEVSEKGITIQEGNFFGASST